MHALKFIIADDHPLFRGALKQAVQDLAVDQIVLEAGDFEGARQVAHDNPDADLMLLDLAMPGVSGFSGLLSLRAEFPSLPIIVVSASDYSGTVRKVLDLGASGFISKSSGLEEIRAAIQSVLDGDICLPDGYLPPADEDPCINELLERLRSLTPQQSRVLTMLGEGLLNKQIAYELGVSEATIKAHVSAILCKLNVDSRTQAVIKLSKLNVPLVA